MSDTVAEVLAKFGVFKGFEGLEGLANAADFWDMQAYGTRIYYGPGIADYLHRHVLGAAITVLKDHERLERENAALLLQAQSQAQEARTQRSTVHECYRAVTGSLGEPGDWNGAQPVKGRLEALERENADLRNQLDKYTRMCEAGHSLGDHLDLIEANNDLRKQLEQAEARIEAAIEIVNDGVSIMTDKQLGKWAGVRAFLEQPTDQYLISEKEPE